jgi:hypothetical protein
MRVSAAVASQSNPRQCVPEARERDQLSRQIDSRLLI